MNAHRNAGARDFRTTDAGDGLDVLDADGDLLFRGDASRMWDSSGAGSYADRVRGPAGGRKAAMGVEVGQDTITIAPDREFLTDARTSYPVFLDPSYHWAGSKNHHVVVQSAWPDARNYDRTDGDLGDLKAGVSNYPKTSTSRSYLEMNMLGVRGKKIHSATLRTRVIHSYACNGDPTELWLTHPIGPGTTWHNQPGWVRRLDTTSVSNNVKYCPSHGGADFSVTNAVAQGAREYWPAITVMLKASNADLETWRRFDLNPVLEVRYNSYPNAPDSLGMEGGLLPCARGDARPYVGVRDPQLRARVTDPDGGSLTGRFALHRGPAGDGALVGNYSATGVPSGSFAQVDVPESALSEQETYNWSVHSSDGELSSNWVGNCEFTVDRTPPGLPAVTSTDYPFDTPSGGLGQTGTFSFDAAGTSDVQYYLYSFTEEQTDDPQNRVDANGLGGGASIEWTPTLDGPQTLFLRSVDRAGNRSEIYRYRVFVKADDPLKPGLTSHWALDGDLADGTGNGHALTAAGAATVDEAGYRGQAVLLDGVDDRLHSQGPVVDTSGSFSVSAWAKLDAIGRWPAVASQDGARVSAFQLQATPEGEWGFAMFPEDVDGGGTGHVRVRSPEPVEVGVWTHLLAVYDDGADKLRLYVDGVLAGETPYSSGWNATGDFQIGGAKWSGQRVDAFPGMVDDVRVYQRVVVDSEAALLANQPVVRAYYALDEGAGTTTRDEVTARNATLEGTASWDTGEFTSVRVIGGAEPGTGLVRAPRPAIRTDRSYTVAAWVRLDELIGNHTAVSVFGDTASPFWLQYRPDNNKWNFGLTGTAAQEGAWLATSAGDAVAGEWTHLTGVYDAVADEARIYVNGQLSGVTPGAQSWNGNGDLLLGRGRWDGRDVDPWNGLVDEVKVYSGVPTDQEIGQLAVRF
ncbi:LamG-like jellyroll fold domain-containing protein [Amycolatopsis aidingensis]|uniref:LamG-like jellyroll fold domain-containing protein n=1 Tax=Amycolatopsis aidingensis TaxID=2842453 RepID=UPI001E634577|nr:LamG-like jellyroll fold domain-containing protein [Amycolatopsis aidingensis]